MFFIGIFGVQSKSQPIRTEQSIICPVCGAYSRYDVIQSYTYFHIFFLPVWKWNYRYFIKTRCCQRLCELDQVVGTRIARGEAVEIKSGDLNCEGSAQPRVCLNCSRQVDPKYNYCPNCGNRM